MDCRIVGQRSDAVHRSGFFARSDISESADLEHLDARTCASTGAFENKNLPNSLNASFATFSRSEEPLFTSLICQAGQF
jgi:hypothetical protein